MALKDWQQEKQLTNRITETIKAGNVHHAYIIQGDKRTDVVKFAKDFLKAINCQEEPGQGCDTCLSCRKINNDNCEDLIFVEPDGETIKDQDIFDMQRFLQKKPNGPRNMAIIRNAETITERAQNRLLKTLEEPSGEAVIILLVENADRLLETVRSRCVLFKLKTSDAEVKQEDYELAKEIAQELTSEDYFHKVVPYCDKIKTSEELERLLDALELYFRNCVLREEKNAFFSKNDLLKFIEYIEEARFRMEYKMNIRYVLKSTLLKIGG